MKSLFFSKAFIFISRFLVIHKEQEKMAKIFFITNFLSISLYAFTFKRSFCEKPLDKITLRHVCTSCVQFCGKITTKIFLKTKTWGCGRVAAYGEF